MENLFLSDPQENLATGAGGERMWPLDAALAALGGLALFTSFSYLPSDQPRWWLNPWTYAAAIPLVVIALSLTLRYVASRFIRRSLQLGFLLSVILHLLLVMWAVNQMILTPLSASAAADRKQHPSPQRKSVADTLFTPAPTPPADEQWSRPVPAEPQTPQIPAEARTVPPQELALSNLPEAPPSPQEPVPQTAAPLLPRSPSDTSLPVPANIAAREASPRESRRSAGPPEESLPQVEVPEIPASSAGDPPRRTLEREIETPSSSLPPSLLPRLAEATTEIADRAEREPSVLSATEFSPRRPTDRFQSSLPEITATVDENAPRPRNRISASQSSLGPAATVGPPPSVPAVAAASAALSSGDSNGDSSDATADAMATEGVAGVPAAFRNRLDEDSSAASALAAGKGGSGDSLRPPGSAETIDLSAPAMTEGLLRRAPGLQGRGDLDQVPEIAAGGAAAGGASPGRLPRKKLGQATEAVTSAVVDYRAFDRRALRTQEGSIVSPDSQQVGPETELAIERGLAYLAARQGPDGNWSLQGHGEEVLVRSDTAATGLALLAFQGAGYTHQQHQYSQTVLRGLKYLLANQRPSGDLYRPEDESSNRNAWLYSHAIAALALCEAYGMTRDPQLREPAQRAINFIVRGQDERLGGWRYTPNASSDTSVTGWMMMALKSGELSGLAVSRATYAGIGKWMEIAQASPTQSWEYRYNPYAADTDQQRHGRQPTQTMTAVGLLARLYLGWRRGRTEMKRGADVLASDPPAIGSLRDPRRDTYYWYYATQVMFHMGDQRWEQWNAQLNPILLSSQISEGPDAGSWDPLRPVPDRWGAHAGRIYVTAMNLLSLEVYYRHLPLYEETAK